MSKRIVGLIVLLLGGCRSGAPVVETASPPLVEEDAANKGRLTIASKSSINRVGTTYVWAQVASWLDPNHFAVGRWDGSMSVFRRPAAGEYGPGMTQVLRMPSGKPTEMSAKASAHMLVTSNDERSLAVWEIDKMGLNLIQQAGYDPSYGTANSGAALSDGAQNWFVSGHANGYVIIWRQSSKELQLERAVDLRSPNPIPSPFKLWNVRALVAYKAGIAVSGSEDGDIALIKIPEGSIITRMRYNPTAQRGINDLAISDSTLFLANCSVGPNDKNLWMYHLSEDKIFLVDSINLIKNVKRDQVFNFSVTVVKQAAQLRFFAGTEEGLLWAGAVENSKLKVLSMDQLECEGGAKLSIEGSTQSLLAVSRSVNLFQY